MNDIGQIVNNFEDVLNKKGAKSKGKTKAQIDKSWKKSKETYSKLKSQHDKLKKESDKINERLEAIKSLLMSAKQDMLHYYETNQFVDLSGATSVIQYDNEARDVGYVIDKEEYHLDLNDARDLVKSPMKSHKKNNKVKTREEPEGQEDSNEADDFLFDDELFGDDGWCDDFETAPNFRFVE